MMGGGLAGRAVWPATGPKGFRSDPPDSGWTGRTCPLQEPPVVSRTFVASHWGNGGPRESEWRERGEKIIDMDECGYVG